MSQVTSQKYSNPSSQKGFSLIELMVVIVIMGLLAGLVGPAMFKKLGKAKTKTAQTQIEMLSASLDSFRLDVGRYPTEKEGLKSLRSSIDNNNWDGPYLKKEVPLDPWGFDYIYKNPGKHNEIDLLSLGADNKDGGQDENVDVGSW